jgi:hypothetical protein
MYNSHRSYLIIEESGGSKYDSVEEAFANCLNDLVSLLCNEDDKINSEQPAKFSRHAPSNSKKHSPTVSSESARAGLV